MIFQLDPMVTRVLLSSDLTNERTKIKFGKFPIQSLIIVSILQGSHYKLGLPMVWPGQYADIVSLFYIIVRVLLCVPQLSNVTIECLEMQSAIKFD